MKSARGRVRAAIAIAAVTACAVSLSACADGGKTAEHVVTSEQSELLAITRFKNFDRGSRAFSVSLAVSGVATRLQGWVDYGSKLGYAEVTGSFDSEALLWTDGAVGSIVRDPDSSGNPTLPIPETSDPGWQIKEMDPAASPLFALLAAISALGQDRPDNPLLLQQSGALWLRQDKIGETEVTVFSAPSSDKPLDTRGSSPDAESSRLKLWVDSTGLLLRAEIYLNDSWLTVEFPDVETPRLQMPES